MEAGVVVKSAMVVMVPAEKDEAGTDAWTPESRIVAGVGIGVIGIGISISVTEGRVGRVRAGITRAGDRLRHLVAARRHALQIAHVIALLQAGGRVSAGIEAACAAEEEAAPRADRRACRGIAGCRTDGGARGGT